MNSLLKKYNIPGPRYTSYPTVPYWNSKVPDEQRWCSKAKRGFDISNEEEGISIYVHLPFCESLCTYCGCNTRITVNHAVESPYINAVLKEWKMYRKLFSKQPRIKEIHLGGGTPTFFSPSNLSILIQGILEDCVICEDPEFSFEAHPNNTTEDHLQKLYSLGFRRLSLGIQDFNPEVQHIMNRIQSYEQVEDVVRNARAIGYTSINFDLIYGLPRQTAESITDTIEKVNSLKPDRIAFYSYAHVPWIKPGQRMFTEMDLPADEEKRLLYETGRDLLAANGYVEIGMDHFTLTTDELYKASLNGNLHRNFMGYTSSNTQLLLGLGVSSISDAWDAFSQNVKSIKEYYALLKEGRLPLLKNYFHSREDLFIRQHILDIMCRMKTNMDTTRLHFEIQKNILDRLEEPIADGLVTVKGGLIEVTEQGRPFLRNICMAFDQFLEENNVSTFSKTI